VTVSAPTQQHVSPIPEGFHTITPTLICDGAAAAIDFYVRAFGAVELDRAAGPDGKIMHAMIQIGDSRIMLGDEFPEMGCRAPRTIGGTPVSLHLYVEDADAFYERAIAAGATATMPICDAFWGDRYGRLLDPFGHDWAIATHVRDVSEEEIAKAAQECMS
jgi:PhnB protein